MIIYPITALWSLTIDFANETSINFNRRHWPSVVLQMAARGVVQLTSYHPPLVLLSMATHLRCTLSSASMNPQLVYVGCQPLDHSNVLFWNNYCSHTECDDNIREGNQFCTFGHKNSANYTLHYSIVKISPMASQITRGSIAFSTVCSGADQRKHQSSASMAFVRGIHRWPVNSPHKDQ